MSKENILKERNSQLESIAKGTSGLVSLNTRITHEANEHLDYIWAMKQAEYNYIKFPKRVAVEYAIHSTYLRMLQDEEQPSQEASKHNPIKRDPAFYYSMSGGNR